MTAPATAHNDEENVQNGEPAPPPLSTLSKAPPSDVLTLPPQC